MASQAEPAAKVLAVADRRHGSGASALGTPSTSSGASSSELPPPDGELSDASGSFDDESESGSEMFSDEEGESDGLHSDDEREHVESMTTDDSAMEDSQPAAALEQEASGQPKAPAGPVEPLTSAAVADRASAMFVVGAAEPRASGLPIIGKVPTKELVQLAFVAANELCDAHGKALSSRLATLIALWRLAG